MQPCKLAGMMLSMVYATSGCGVLGYDLKPSSVSGLTVEETTSPIGLFLTLKGLAMDSSYGPERFENVRMGNAMYISAYMKWRQRPDFDYQCFVPNDIERVFWGDVCIWDRAKYITIDGNINPCYAVRMAKDLFKWISGTNAITHVDEVKFLGYKSMESYEGHVNQHYFDRDRNEILPEACESRLGELLRCK